mmetsp:Transcript_19934/g.46382  ORF Transcript_19934/g.46382 Transcript_19934/m.46382 type:complete len:135 (+) Transcript_19934:114-518(+)
MGQGESSAPRGSAPSTQGTSTASGVRTGGSAGVKLQDASEQVDRELRLVFDKLDKEGKGSISMKELVLAVKGLARNPTKAELEELILQVRESDFDARVDYPNFRLMMLRTMQNPDQNRLSDAERDEMISRGLGW